MLTIRTAIAQGSELLGRDGIPEPRLTAELLLAHAIHCDRAYFYAHPEQELREVEWIHYGRYLDERLKGKPTQYITKNQEFYGRDFKVTRDVLIPRPETELLVETITKLNRAHGVIIDVGTGSGAIAITLALELNHSVIATDLSYEACAIANSNALNPVDSESLSSSKSTSSSPFATRSLTSSSPTEALLVPTFDDRAGLQREGARLRAVLLVLFGGPDGLAVYKRVIPEARRVLKPGGILAIELGFGQSEAVSALASGWLNLQLIPDLAGIPRILLCERP